jgi:hypothetical protein
VSILSAVVVSPVAAGIFSVLFALSAVPLTTLIRPSKWPRLSVWPCCTLNAIFLGVVSLIVAWFSPAPDILTCDPVIGRLFVCWNWPRLVIPVGLYRLLVRYDKKQCNDFCDAGTEVLITRIAVCGRRSLIVHSNADLSIWQRLLIRINYGWRFFEHPSWTGCYAGADFHLSLLSVQFDVEPDGTRTRRASEWVSPCGGVPVKFSYNRTLLERVERYLSEFPLALGLAIYAIHRVLLKFGCYDPVIFGAVVLGTRLAWLLTWLLLGRFVDACLGWLVALGQNVDIAIDGFFENCWAYLTTEFVETFILACKWSAVTVEVVALGVYFFCDIESIPPYVHVAVSCSVLRLLAFVPVVRRPIMCARSYLWRWIRSCTRSASSAAFARAVRAAAAARFTASAFALAAKAALTAFRRAVRGLLVSVRSGVAGAAVVSARVGVLCVYFGTKSVVSACICFSVSPSRQSPIVPARQARLMYYRPSLAPLADAVSEVESVATSSVDCSPVPSEGAGASAAKEENAESFGNALRCEKENAGVKKVRNGGAVLRAMTSSVAPVRRSLRLARRVAVSFSRG